MSQSNRIASTPLRIMTGSGLNLDTYTRFQERFGVERIVEGYGGTELNTGISNLDNKPGSCGRIPFPERSTPGS